MKKKKKTLLDEQGDHRATHSDTDNIHSHIIVNSVSFKDGKLLHLSPTSIEEQRQVSDQIFMAHGFSVLEPYTGQKR
jgi:hypothetical protein